MKGELYTECTLHIVFENEPNPPLTVGDFFTSSGGSNYEIQALRRVKSSDIKYKLTCLRVPEKDVDDSRRWRFWWHERRRKK